jgi:hypothetical protein
MIKFKAWNARPLIDILSPRHWHFPVLRNSRAIAKFHNMGIGHFGHNAFIHELIRGSLVHLPAANKHITVTDSTPEPYCRSCKTNT